MKNYQISNKTVFNSDKRINDNKYRNNVDITNS